MLLVAVVENQIQTSLSDKRVLLFIIKLQAQGRHRALWNASVAFTSLMVRDGCQ